MRITISHLTIAAVAGGVFGGLAVGLVLQWTTPEPARSANAKPERREARMTDDVEARLLSLEAQVTALRRQREASRALSDYAKVLAEQEGPPDGHGTTPSAAIDGEDPRFELAVRTVVDKVEGERDDERRARRDERRREQARGQADFIADRLQLSDDVRRKVEQIFIDQMDEMRRLRDEDPDAGVRRPSSRAEWRERVESIRRGTDAKLGEVLSARELEEYQKLREEDGLGPGAGRGRGRR